MIVKEVSPFSQITALAGCCVTSGGVQPPAEAFNERAIAKRKEVNSFIDDD
jgi:hypothetical protein